MKYSTSLFLVVSVLTCSCSNKNNIILLDDDKITEVELEETCSDIIVKPIKYSNPMKGIGSCLHFGDYDFLLSTDYRNLYCVKDDTVISELDKGGRGRGEYLEIRAFAFSPDDSLLYVAGPHGLNIYKGLNFDFLDVISDIPPITTMRLIGENKILAACYIQDNDYKEQNGLFLIDTKKGIHSKPIIAMNRVSKMFHSETDYYQKADSVYFVIGDRVVNKIYLYNKGIINSKISFKYSKKLQIPKRAWAGSNNSMSKFGIFSDYIRENDFCIGASYPIINDKSDCLMFWNFHGEDDNILNIIENDQIRRMLIKIPGIDGTLSPDFVSDNYYVTLFQNLYKYNNTYYEDNNFSNLTKEIFRAYENNNDNPVILKYHIK